MLELEFDDLLRGAPGSVDTAAFIEMGGKFHWTHLEGYREFVHACVLACGFDSELEMLSAVRCALPEAVATIPLSWKRSFRRGDWAAACNGAQVTHAWNGPMRLDKACIVLHATTIACKRQPFRPLRLDVFKYVSLHPAIYKLVGTEPLYALFTMFRGRLKDSEKKLIEGISQRLLVRDPDENGTATHRVAESFIAQALQGRAMTWRNADLIATALNTSIRNRETADDAPGIDCLPKAIKVEMTNGRNDGGKFTRDKHCNQAEAAFVALGEIKLSALRTDIAGRARVLKR